MVPVDGSDNRWRPATTAYATSRPAGHRGSPRPLPGPLLAPDDAPVLQGHEVVVLKRLQRVIPLGEPACQEDQAQGQDEYGVLGHEEMVQEGRELAQARAGREIAAVDDVPVEEDG